MISQFIATAASLTDKDEPYVMAFVVNRQVPSSGKPGDKAIIHMDGTITGWIGGGCTRGIVMKEASLAIQDGRPRFVRISPNGDASAVPGIESYHMTCHSGGMVELYLEPVMPAPKILIMGRSHVAMALNRVAVAMGNSVTVIGTQSDHHEFPGATLVDDFANDLITPNTFVVVCTQGENDELALLQAARSTVSYIGFVASRKKANAIFGYLRDQGVSMDRLREIKTPAGLDINAKSPDEVAVSILAEIIQKLRNEDEEPSGQAELVSNDKIYINPVCGVPVEKSSAKHVVDYQGEPVYFCCDGCKVKFDAEPARYMASAE